MARSMTLVVAIAAAAAAIAPSATDQKVQLAQIQQFVGNWRGVGQPQRGSTKDSWTEEADWVWTFGKEELALTAQLPHGKYFRALKLSAAEQPGRYVLSATPASGNDVRYDGQLDDQGQLLFTADQVPADLPARISFRFVAGGDRLLMLLERKSATGGPPVRIAEIGYTRQGSGFGKNAAQRECIVTGGLGTIEVTHDGKKYYVCCTGCRDYFNENPQKVLDEYAARKAAEKK